MESPLPYTRPPPRTSFPIIAIAIIGILATAFLLVGYYIFVIKCCLNWHRIDLLRRFSISRRRRVDDSLMVYSPAAQNRGLDEAAIRSIPIQQFKKGQESDRKDCECAVCLNEFQETEKLRIIPNCGHFFHIDCIDVWLQNNANCPLCRRSISAAAANSEIKFPSSDQINRSPQDPNFFSGDFTGRDEDYVVIEIGSDAQSLLGNQGNFNSGEFLSITPSPRKSEPKILQKKGKKISHLSSMGDEYINSRKKDERFAVQPIRRSFSMDSADDRQLYLAVQEIIQKRWYINSEVISPNEGCSSSNGGGGNRTRRSFFSFGHGRSSRNAVQRLALESD